MKGVASMNGTNSLRWYVLCGVRLFGRIVRYVLFMRPSEKRNNRLIIHLLKSHFLSTIVVLISAGTLFAQRPPIIDMHMHALKADAQGPPPLGMCTPINLFPTWDPNGGNYMESFFEMMKNPPCDDPVWSPETDEELMQQTFEVMEKYNIYSVTSGDDLELVQHWQNLKPDRIIPSLFFRVSPDSPSPDSIKALYASGSIAVLGEVVTQYQGIVPSDVDLMPYWAMAEEADLPVGIHIGPGPPGVRYMGAKFYRAQMHSALTLEEVLMQHPNLRVYIMHGGFPKLDDLLALLYAHPQVYIDFGVVVFTQSRETFYRWLQGIADAGFSNRIMFGSDQMVWPGVIERSIQTIEEAPFLTEAQKRDIFYNNAARFLRLSQEEIDRHHGR